MLYLGTISREYSVLASLQWGLYCAERSGQLLLQCDSVVRPEIFRLLRFSDSMRYCTGIIRGTLCLG